MYDSTPRLLSRRVLAKSRHQSLRLLRALPPGLGVTRRLAAVCAHVHLLLGFRRHLYSVRTLALLLLLFQRPGEPG